MESLTESIGRNLNAVVERVSVARARSGRAADSVKLVAVTKAVGLPEIRALIQLGVQDIGENRVPDAVAKMAEVEADVNWHMIGHLQRRKVRDTVGRFAMIHSVDSDRLLRELEKRNAAAGTACDVLAEFNVSGEGSKYGLGPSDAPAFCLAAAGCEHLRLRGFMTMAPFVDDPEEVRGVFASLRELLEKTNAAGAYPEPLSELSMGMTNDFEVAVEEGATIVRIGTALFR